MTLFSGVSDDMTSLTPMGNLENGAKTEFPSLETGSGRIITSDDRTAASALSVCSQFTPTMPLSKPQQMTRQPSEAAFSARIAILLSPPITQIFNFITSAQKKILAECFNTFYEDLYV